MSTTIAPDRSRLIAGGLAAALQLLIGYALIAGLSVPIVSRIEAAMTLVNVALLPLKPPPPVVPRQVAPRQPSGRAAPPNRTAKAAAIVAPPAIILPEVPPPVLAALTPGPGAADHAGAAPVVGPGTGAGGQGDGTGSGGAGDGDGNGGGTPSRRIGGRIKDSDYPRGASVSGVVGVDYTVGVDGRVTECTIARSSGSAELDETTCRLIQKRFRFEPARDAQGRKVPDYWSGDHHWMVTDRTLPADDAPR